MITLILALALAAPQEKGKKGGMSNEESGLSESIKFHYVSEKSDPAALKAALERVKGVEGVTFTPNENSVTVMFSGTLAALRGVEAAAAGAGAPAYVLSHASVRLNLKPEKGSDINGFFKELDATEGVRNSFKREGYVEIVCDLEKFSIGALPALAEKYKFKGEVATHEILDITTTGDKYTEFAKALNGVKGLVCVKIDNTTKHLICIAIKKAATDEAIKKAAEKAGMKIDQIKRQ